jgi:hypothetical protein
MAGGGRAERLPQRSLPGVFQSTPREIKGLAKKAYALYEKFRPEIPPGKKGWGGLRQAGSHP